MANISFGSYMQQLADALEDSDGVQAAKLLSFDDPHIASTKLHQPDAVDQCGRWLDSPWDELVAAHLRACWAVGSHDFVEAYRAQNIVVQSFTRIFGLQKEENWGLTIMFAVTLDLRIFATNADVQIQKHGRGRPAETIEKAAELLMGCFRICASDNRATPEDSKKWGMLNLVNQLFKIYFKINKLQLCKPLIRAIDALPMRDKFSISQIITYRYYVGRKAMFESDYKQAEEYMSFAFQRCHKASKQNKRMILIYLLPVKMLLGHMPKASLLKKYDLLQFDDVAKAVCSGNVRLLNSSLEKNESFFIKCGIYLILEKLKVITYRNLFKKVSLMQTSNMINIATFTTALKFVGEEDVDDDETECLIANLIYENKIKGYISHAHRKLVISKQTPFPPISS